MQRPDGKTVEFTYDALGRRISKSFAGNTRWVWNAYMPLHEWNYSEKEKLARDKEDNSRAVVSETFKKLVEDKNLRIDFIPVV